MTDVERRRLKLLQETQKAYSGRSNPPAVHPRYQSSYHSLYGNEQNESLEKRSTFWVRLIISVLIFALCYVIDYRKEEYGFVNSKTIVREIQRNLFGK